MDSPNIRDIITSFSPTLDLLAIILGDGRIKIWDTAKGQLQNEFVDIESAKSTSMLGNQEKGHLSMDYTCMKWLSLNKKKRKLESSLLVLGTGTGDVLSIDVSMGQVKWRINLCHPGGVSDISFPAHCLHIYSAGADGMVCKIDSLSGNLLGKFSASSTAISSLSISPDGKLIAAASAQLKIFNCSNHKKLQKFSGHPGAVRRMIFSEDGRYVLSSASGERYIAIWSIDGSKKKSALSFLVMDHPAVFLDSRCINNEDNGNSGLSVLAISEIGDCYFWYASIVDELRNSKPTKIRVPVEEQRNQGPVPKIFAAKLQTISEPACGHVFLAYGFGIKPSFNKVMVHLGTDVDLTISRDGILLPVNKFHKSKKSSTVPNQVSAFDRSNAEGALHPVPKVIDLHDGKVGAAMIAKKSLDGANNACIDTVTLSMEERLVSLGILNNNDNALSSTVISKILTGFNLESNTPQNKMKAAIVSLDSGDATNLLKYLLEVWKSRRQSGKHVLPWIYCILMYHGDYVRSQDPKLLDTLHKFTKSRGAAMNALFQLCGRLQLVSAQIDKARNNSGFLSKHDQDDDSEDEYVDEVLYDVDDDSQSSDESNEG